MNTWDQNGKSKNLVIPIVSTILQDGSIVEMIRHPEEGKTELAVWKDGSWKIEKEIPINENQKLAPFSPRNNLIQNEVILLSSEPKEYGTEEELLREIQSFIHKYVDVSPSYEKIATYYVLFSWVYDSFHELPYLRLRGEPGSGKTRFLLTVGSICYKPIFASGASTISPIFRILDAVKGTLIIDESDFRFSDEKAEMIKILNNGNIKGFPVLRTDVSGNTREYNPTAYHVFGPKLIATRGFFEDKALESRLFTEETGQRKLREDVPINLPDSHKKEALEIRNKLLMFRFRNFHKRRTPEDLVDRAIEPRLNQIFTPLLSVIENEKSREDIRAFARIYNGQVISDRGLDLEAQILDVIKDLSAVPETKLSVREITIAFNDKYGEEYERKITSKGIGHILRAKLSLKTQKSNGNFIIPSSEQPRLNRLYARYGLTDLPESPQPPPSPQNQEPYLLDG